MEYLKDCHIIGLDSVPAQIATYEKAGFKASCNSIKGYAICGP